MDRRLSRYQKVQELSAIRRGDVCLVNFDPTIGFEIRKTRPAVVLQNDIGNRFSPLTIVAAITSKITSVPFAVEVPVSPTRRNGLAALSSVRLDQIRTIDQSRIHKRLGKLDAASMQRVDDALKISLGLVNL